MSTEANAVRYVGFWSRFLAFLLDSIIQTLVFSPLFLMVYGREFFANPAVMETPLGYALTYGLPLLYAVLCWKYKSATPGKYMMGMSIVDASTGGKPSTGRLVLRYLGYYLNIFTLFIGFIWIAFDRRKQGLHDKIAGTVVIMNPTPQD